MTRSLNPKFFRTRATAPTLPATFGSIKMKVIIRQASLRLDPLATGELSEHYVPSDDLTAIIAKISSQAPIFNFLRLLIAQSRVSTTRIGHGHLVDDIIFLARCLGY